jgi:hypothetical protein
MPRTLGSPLRRTAEPLLSATALLIQSLKERGIRVGLMDPGSSTDAFYVDLGEYSVPVRCG